jgi:hypothetical protein
VPPDTAVAVALPNTGCRVAGRTVTRQTQEEEPVRKLVAVVAFSVLMATTPAMSLAAPKPDDWSCTKTDPAFEHARAGSSDAPSGGFDKGAENSNDEHQLGSQVNYCE